MEKKKFNLCKSDRYNKSRSSNDNIYNSTQFKKVNKYIQKKETKRYLKSKHPLKTGIVPSYRSPSDNDSVFSDDLNSNYSADGDNSHMTLFNKSNEMMKKTPKLMNNNESFKDQFELPSFNNKGNPSSYNSSPNNTNNINKLLIERDIAMKGEFSKFEKNPNCSMTYGVTDDISHNNSTPFFSQKKWSKLWIKSIESI